MTITVGPDGVAVLKAKGRASYPQALEPKPKPSNGPRKPKSRADIKRKEMAAQRQVVKLLRALRLVFHWTKNEGKKSAKTAALDKASGLVAGWPDFDIATPPPNFPECRGVGMEMKRDDGGVTSAVQLAKHEELRQCQWIVEVVDGFDGARAFLARLGWRT